MAPLDWSWGETYASAPVSLSTAQHPPSLAFGHRANIPPSSLHPRRSHFSFLPDVVWSVAPKPHPSAMGAPQPAAGRKRSRDQLDADADDNSSAPSTAALSTPSPSKSERLDPDDPMDAPTGTWAEELSERLRSSSVAESRPSLGEPRKSARLDPTPTPPAAPVAVDAATLALGVAWSTIPSTPTMAAAARGWARHIESRFPLAGARVLWLNNALPAYLVSAEAEASTDTARCGSPGFFLFDERFAQGRLVAKSWERALDNLRCCPVVFEGEEVMVAGGGRAEDGDVEMD